MINKYGHRMYHAWSEGTQCLRWYQILVANYYLWSIGSIFRIDNDKDIPYTKVGS